MLSLSLILYLKIICENKQKKKKKLIGFINLWKLNHCCHVTMELPHAVINIFHVSINNEEGLVIVPKIFLSHWIFKFILTYTKLIEKQGSPCYHNRPWRILNNSFCLYLLSNIFTNLSPLSTSNQRELMLEMVTKSNSEKKCHFLFI